MHVVKLIVMCDSELHPRPDVLHGYHQHRHQQNSNHKQHVVLSQGEPSAETKAGEDHGCEIVQCFGSVVGVA